METLLEAVRRETFGRNEAGRLRRQGRIPAVLYGGAEGAAEPLAVDPKELMRILHSDAGVNTLISLSVAGGPATRVLMKEHQLDPITHHLLHADFYRVAMDKLLQVTVPIVLKGEPRGVKQQGGILEFLHKEIELECLPTAIPEHIDIDVSELELGQAIYVKDLATTAAWAPLSDADLMLVHVVSVKEVVEPAPEAAAAATAAAPAAGTEPEVIKKGKTEKEGDDKDKPKK